MKNRKLLVLGLGSLALIAGSMGVAKINAYADENMGEFSIYAQAKKKMVLKIYKYDENGNESIEPKLLEEVDLGETENSDKDPKAYYSEIHEKLDRKKAVVMGIQSTDDDSYIFTAYKAGNLIIKDPATDTEQVIPYDVKTPNTQNPQQVTYTLPKVDPNDYFYEKVNENGEIETIDYNESEATVSLTEENRFKDTILTKYSAGRENGLAEILKPTKKVLTRYSGVAPTVEEIKKELMSCLDFGDKQKKVDVKKLDNPQIPENDIEKLHELANVGEHRIDIVVYFVDKSYALYTMTVKVLPQSTKPKDNNKQDSGNNNNSNNNKPDNNKSNNNKPDNNNAGNNNSSNNNTGNSNSNNSSSNNSHSGGNSNSSGGGSGSSGGGRSSGGSSGGSARGGGSSRGGSGSAGTRAKRDTSSSTLPSYVLRNGTWANNNGTWKYRQGDKEYRDVWAAIENPFANEKMGQSRFSWFRFDKDGNMLTNWQWIKDEKDGKIKCYYLNPRSDGSLGAMLANTTTPDGYSVNASGEWVVNGVVQTK